jgi:hypothetical protein
MMNGWVKALVSPACANELTKQFGSDGIDDETLLYVSGDTGQNLADWLDPPHRRTSAA